MIDLEKEKILAREWHDKCYGDIDFIFNSDEYVVEAWKERAKLAQAEITELKQQLSEAHASRIEFVEYMRKIESGEFVLMPRKLSENMVLHAHKYHEGEPYLPYSLYESFVEAVEKEDGIQNHTIPSDARL